MKTQKTNLTRSCADALDEFYKAWANVENAVSQLQDVCEKTRQSISELATKESARDPKTSETLDRFLYLERVTMDAGQVVDDLRRGTDVPRT
jgi:hypothetical protein